MTSYSMVMEPLDVRADTCRFFTFAYMAREEQRGVRVRVTFYSMIVALYGSEDDEPLKGL